MKIRPLILLILFAPLIYGQTEPLNQLDSTGKKHGKWVLYLDAIGGKLKDSANAVYWRYTWYDHGVHIQPMGDFIGKKGRIESNSSIQTGKCNILDGEYKCFDSNGRLRFVHFFSNGEYAFYKEFGTKGNLVTFFDYTKHADGQPHSWYMYTYDKNGNVNYEGFVKKDLKGKWPRMRG
jgi:hypothetical protein